MRFFDGLREFDWGHGHNSSASRPRRVSTFCDFPATPIPRRPSTGLNDYPWRSVPLAMYPLGRIDICARVAHTIGCKESTQSGSDLRFLRRGLRCRKHSVALSGGASVRTGTSRASAAPSPPGSKIVPQTAAQSGSAHPAGNHDGYSADKLSCARSGSTEACQVERRKPTFRWCLRA